MEHHTRKFILRTTCLKNGGFRKYQPLPPQEVFQHVHWVLGSEIDVKVKRRQTLFNRETEWRCLPVYLTTNKGLLFVYMKNDAGYVLRVPSALRIQFDGSKKVVKRQQGNNGPSFAYSATIILQYHFGELHFRFNNSNNLHPWRAILMAAHDSENGIAAVGEKAAKEVFGSTSLESVVSTKSVVPDANDKEKAERVVVHRHSINPTAASESLDGESSSTISQFSTISEYSMNAADSVAQSPKAVGEGPATFINAVDHGVSSDEFLSIQRHPWPIAEAVSNESLMEHLSAGSRHGMNSSSPVLASNKSSDVNDDLDRSFDLMNIPAYRDFLEDDIIDNRYMDERNFGEFKIHNSQALSPIPEASESCAKSPEVIHGPSFAYGIGTSEVDVSCKDFAEDPDTVSDTSITAAFKTSPVTTRQSAASLFGSTKSFNMDNGNIPESVIVADMLPPNNVNALQKLIAQFETPAPRLPPIAPQRRYQKRKFEESVKMFEGIAGKTVKDATISEPEDKCVKKFSDAPPTVLQKPAGFNDPVAARKSQQPNNSFSFI